MKFPKKCEGCPYVSCRCMHWLYKTDKTEEIRYKDVRRFYRNFVSAYFNRSTISKLLQRLRESKWLVKDKEAKEGKGKLYENKKLSKLFGNVYKFGEKAYDYLMEYNSFLKGPFCRKEGGEEKEVKKEKVTIKEPVKPKLVEEIHPFER